MESDSRADHGAVAYRGDAGYPEDAADRAERAPRRGRGALVVAGLGVLLLTGAAFALSYDGLYAIALAGGVRPSLAFLYPLIFDGFLVLAFAAALLLRSAGPRATWYPWALIVVLLTSAGAGNALHAVGRTPLLSPSAMNVIVAAVPLLALGLAFPLWLLMFAYVRGERRVRAASPGPKEPAGSSDDTTEDTATGRRGGNGGHGTEPGSRTGERSERPAAPTEPAPPAATPPSGTVRSSPTPPEP